jgi:hypothetical protein
MARTLTVNPDAPRPAPCQARMVRTLTVNPDAPRPAPCQARMVRTLTDVGGRFGRRETPISGRGPPFHAQLAGSEPCRTWWIDSAVHLACPPCAGERNAVEIRSGGPRQRRSGESGLGARAARGKDARAGRAWALGRPEAKTLGRVGPGRSGGPRQRRSGGSGLGARASRPEAKTLGRVGPGRSGESGRGAGYFLAEPLSLALVCFGFFGCFAFLSIRTVLPGGPSIVAVLGQA